MENTNGFALAIELGIARIDKAAVYAKARDAYNALYNHLISDPAAENDGALRIAAHAECKRVAAEVRAAEYIRAGYGHCANAECNRLTTPGYAACPAHSVSER